MKYVDLIVDNNTNATDGPYTYACREDDIAPGCRVRVPFARGNRLMDGYVIAVGDQPSEKMRNIKEVVQIDRDVRLTQEELETALWMRNRTLCRYIEAIKMFVPDEEKVLGKTKDPFAGFEVSSSVPENLTGEQARAFEGISGPLDHREHKVFLLFGVTGSGKTEIYLQAMQKVLDQGRQGIVMVPEIALTPQVIRRFMDRFGKEKVAVIHSRLTRKQRVVEYDKIRSGQAPVVIGARSAVFAPLKEIGLIVLDESHETSYKSDQSPKYDTLEVAVKRAMAHGAVVVAGSATPSLADYYRSEKGIFTRLSLTERFNETPMPQVHIADMRQELRRGNRSIFSQVLADGIGENLAKNKQIILFLNRRGYASFVSCRECGHVIRCSECGISMPYHKDQNACVCHYCGRKEPLPEQCPACGGTTIRSFGAGTQQVEEKVLELYPDARVRRLDLDSVRKKGSMESILTEFEKHKTDILIGTQLVAKGLDVANVGLVGIVSADVTLNIPDFRSSERTFQLVTQAAGRSGRGDEVGQVVIQTYTPEHEAIRCAARHDYTAFYKGEIRLREQIQYPPFCDLFQLILSDEEEKKAAELAERCVRWLKRKAVKELTVMGPIPAPLSKADGAYRYQVLIKSPEGQRRSTSEMLLQLKRLYTSEKEATSLLTMDVNPYSFM
jgi:primosomal protein N' (replication factor Y)